VEAVKGLSMHTDEVLCFFLFVSVLMLSDGNRRISLLAIFG
jgi:hypothetical protein